MADSYLDVGTEEEFPLTPDWATLPKNGFQISRYLFEYRGTVSKMETKNEEAPIQFEASFYLGDKETEYDFLDFIHTHIGRTKRFWLRYPKQYFIITEAFSNGSTTLKVAANNFDLFCCGHERIYIQLTDGTTITRRVSAATYSEANDDVTLQLVTAMDQDVALNEIFITGRYLLVRFDNDVFNLDILTDLKSNVSLNFIELIRDYADLAANP